MKYNLFFIALGLLASVCVSASSADPVTVDLVTIDDGRVQFSGVLGKTLFTSEEDVLTLRSGNTNVSDGLFEFDLSSIPDEADIISVEVLFRTAAVIGNTGATAPVDFFGFAGDGVIELSDEGTGGALMEAFDFTANTPNDTDVSVTLSNLIPIENLINDGNPDDFFTLRTETINFVSFAVDSLESTDPDSTPATLRVTYELSAVPEPSSLALLGFAACGCVLRRRS